MLVSDHNIVVYDESGTVTKRYNLPDLYTGYYFDIGGSHYSLQMEEFAKAIKTEQQFSNVSEAFYAQQLVDAIYNSSSKNTIVTLEEGLE
jgi:predicted dehydrogenase